MVDWLAVLHAVPNYAFLVLQWLFGLQFYVRCQTLLFLCTNQVNQALAMLYYDYLNPIIGSATLSTT